MLIPIETGQCQIGWRCKAVVLPCEDVIDLERELAVDLGKLAILTSATGALPDESDQFFVHDFRRYGRVSRESGGRWPLASPEAGRRGGNYPIHALPFRSRRLPGSSRRVR